MTHISRRTVAKSAAWGIPAVALASAAPAVAASVTVTDLAIEVADPPTDPTTGEYVNTVPIYKNNQTSVAVNASISTSFTITNVGAVAAENPPGTMDLQFIDHGTNVALGTSEAQKFNVVPTTPGVVFTQIAPLTYEGSGNQYAYTYAGTLAPGESVTITVKLWVSPPFAHAAPMQMLFSAFVADTMEGDWDDNSGRTGYIPSFSYFA